MDTLHLDARTATALPLLQTVCAEFNDPEREIAVRCDPALQLAPAQRGPVEAIVRKALSNAVRHAFPGRAPGRAWITLAEEHGRLHLKIADNGPGFPELSGRDCPGRALITRLADELGGYSRFDNRNYAGAEVYVVFPSRDGIGDGA